MDRALNKTDIVYLVVDRLEDQHDLARLARVSRIFWRPCATKLWRETRRIGQVVSLFPPHLRRADARLRPPDSIDDWDRFRAYSRFILTMFVLAPGRDDNPHFPRVSGVEDTSMNVLECLASYRPRNSLFPNLQKLELVIGSDMALKHATSLLSETLQTVTIFTTGALSSDSISSFMAHVPNISPALESVQMMGQAFFDGDDHDLRVSTAMAKLSKLSGLSLSFNGNGETIAAVAHRNSLKRLALYSQTRAPVHISVTLPEVQFFSWYGTPARGASILRSVAMPKVTELALDLNGIARHGSFADILQVIPEKLQVLRRLKLRIQDHVYPIPSDFSPLFSCRALEIVSIETNTSRDAAFMLWDDAQMLQLAQSWPLLRSLDLPSGTMRPGMTPRMSLQSFVYLATCCRFLHTLRLAVDMRDFQLPQNLPPPALDMRTLRLEEFSVISERDTMEFIASIWPNVRLREVSGGTPGSAARLFCQSFNGRQDKKATVVL